MWVFYIISHCDPHTELFVSEKLVLQQKQFRYIISHCGPRLKLFAKVKFPFCFVYLFLESNVQTTLILFFSRCILHLFGKPRYCRAATSSHFFIVLHDPST